MDHFALIVDNGDFLARNEIIASENRTDSPFPKTEIATSPLDSKEKVPGGPLQANPLYS